MRIVLLLITIFYHVYCYSNSTVIGSRQIKVASSFKNLRHSSPQHPGTNEHTHILMRQYEITENRAYQRLLNGLKKDSAVLDINGGDTSNFRDLLPAIYVHPSYAHVTDGKGNTEKYFIGIDVIQQMKKNYVVYTAGVNGLSSFENYMSKLGASVYPFDCTDWKRPEYLFEFYDWCIGKEASFQNNAYSKRKDNHTFFGLHDIQLKFNHPTINMLKMDIEGFEWNLLYSEIINQTKVISSQSAGFVHDGKHSPSTHSKLLETSLPEQLLFELHTEGSNPQCVPTELVRGKKREQVNQLVYQLWMLGYRLMNIEINFEDVYCAELAFIRIG